MLDFAVARRLMVDRQLKPSQVLDDRVLEAILAVPREAFVPGPLAELAYVDEDLEVAPGRFLMQPMVFGRLLQECGIGGDDVILDIGCGPGYSSAVLARLGATVVGLEQDPGLRDRAAAVLDRMGVDNAVVVAGAHGGGDPGHGPYDVIFVNGAMERVPDALCAQLVDGGRLAGVVMADGVGRATIIARDGDAFARRQVFDAAAHVLPGFAAKPGFVF